MLHEPREPVSVRPWSLHPEVKGFVGSSRIASTLVMCQKNLETVCRYIVDTLVIPTARERLVGSTIAWPRTSLSAGRT